MPGGPQQNNRPWLPGQPIEAARLESMRIESLRSLTVRPPLKMIRDGGNVIISLNVNSGAMGPQWMKVAVAANGDGVALCNLWDGTLTGEENIPVLLRTGAGVGDEIYAIIVSPWTGELYAGAPVVWLELGGGGSESTGSYQYTVHQMVIDNQDGWQLPVLANPV